MGLMDFLFGSKPDMQMPDYAKAFQGQMEGEKVGVGRAAKFGKGLWKQYLDDPESLATTSLNAGAVQRQAAGEDYASGANALLAHSGAGNAGQQALQQRMKEMQINRINQAQGINAQQEAWTKGSGGLELYQRGIENRDRTNLGYSGLQAQAMGTGFNNQRQGGGMMGQIFSGLGAGLGMACWIAMELYGPASFETMLLRYYVNFVWTSRVGRLFLKLYVRFGERAAATVKRSRVARACARVVFDRLLAKALRWFLVDRCRDSKS